jgi:hypothetical protein
MKACGSMVLESYCQQQRYVLAYAEKLTEEQLTWQLRLGL